MFANPNFPELTPCGYLQCNQRRARRRQKTFWIRRTRSAFRSPSSTTNYQGNWGLHTLPPKGLRIQWKIIGYLW